MANNKGYLNPLKTKCKPLRFIGFDTETAGKNNDFVCGCLVNDVVDEFFDDADKLKSFLLNNKGLRKYRIVATNLEFDLNTLFGYSDARVERLYRNKLLAVTLSKRVKMIDTLNFVPASVEKLGETIGIPKLPHPKCFKRFPESKEEWKELEVYNKNDAYISYKFMKTFQESINDLGGNLKITIASTTMDVFRRNYLVGYFKQPNYKILTDMYKSYYGGRTEAIKRGTFENVNYYDFNSLYPSVMLENKFPDVNTIKTAKYLNLELEGFSEVSLSVPETFIPLLPLKSDKLIFPFGKLRGWFNHCELREAIDQGCIINKFHRGYFFTDVIDLFNDFVNDLYSKRMNYKKENNEIMQLSCKLLLNSLYGKFAQKIDTFDKFVNASELKASDYDNAEVEQVSKDVFKLTKGVKPFYSSFIIPIWSSYITSYARIKLFKALPKDVIYMDTDSIMTKKDLGDSKELGKLKKEYILKKVVVIKPKMYSFIDENDKEFVKIKGVGKTNIERFNNIITTGKADIHRFARWKESLRRGLIPNQELDFVKRIDLEDSKRNWLYKKFIISEQQESKALEV